MKSPYLNRHLVKKLQQLGAERNHAKAKALFEALPATPKAVVALCCYLGSFHRGTLGDLSERSHCRSVHRALRLDPL